MMKIECVPQLLRKTLNRQALASKGRVQQYRDEDPMYG
jgi:hypothetical protein